MHEGAPIFPSLPSLLLLSISSLQIHELLFRIVYASWQSQKRSQTKKPYFTVNDLLVQKALSSPDLPLLAYPGSLKGIDDYVHYTARDLDRFADEAAKAYIAMGVPVKVRSFYCFSVSMLTIFRRTRWKMRLSQYWHRLIWVTL